MRAIILAAALLFSLTAFAQNTTAENIIEGSKALVELVRVLKSPASVAYQPAVALRTDSCKVKNTGDLGFQNNTGKSASISLFKRNGNVYELNILTIKILPKAQEWFYELKSGIYKYKIEIDEGDGKRILYREGEIKLDACAHEVKEI